MTVVWLRKAGYSYLQHAVMVPYRDGDGGVCGFVPKAWTTEMPKPNYLGKCRQCETVLKRRKARAA